MVIFIDSQGEGYININMKIHNLLFESQKFHGIDAESKQYYEIVVDWLREKLNIPDSVQLQISMGKSKMPFDNNQNGVTIPNPNKPNEVYVFLHPGLSKAEQLSALAHELVHVKQLADGRLEMKLANGKYDVTWEGKPLEKIKYSRSHPWEVEAHSQERPLVHEIIKQFGNPTG